MYFQHIIFTCINVILNIGIVITSYQIHGRSRSCTISMWSIPKNHWQIQNLKRQFRLQTLIQVQLLQEERK